jgi:hypothetical protein
MFEREIKFIYDFNVNQVKKLGTSFTFNSLLNVNLHPSILNYISAEIDYLIYEDRKKLIDKSNFDYSGEDINKYFIQINQEIRKSKKLSIEYIDQLIINATSFTANFLVQPKWALTKLVFEKENSLTVQEVLQILKYIHYYKHLRELLERFLIKKRIVSIDKLEFEILIDKIYTQLFSAYAETIIDNVLNSLADFFNVGAVNKTKIPLSTIDFFLKERNLNEYIDKLNSAFPDGIKQNYSLVELRKILYLPSPIQARSYLDKVLNREEPIAFNPEENPSQTSITEEIAELSELPVPEIDNANQPIAEVNKEVELKEESKQIIGKEEETISYLSENKTEFAEEHIEPEKENNLEETKVLPDSEKLEEQIIPTEQLFPFDIEAESKEKDFIQNSDEVKTISELEEFVENKSETLQVENESSTKEELFEENNELLNQSVLEEKTSDEIEDTNIQVVPIEENKVEMIDQGNESGQNDTLSNEEIIPGEEYVTDINQNIEKGEADKPQFPLSGQIEETKTGQSVDRPEKKEVIGNEISLEDLNKNEVEELDLQSIFDDEDFLILGEEKLNVSFEDFEVEKLIEPDLIDFADGKPGESNFDLLNEKDDKKKSLPDKKIEFSKETDKDEIVQELNEENIPDEAESKVISEIDREINKLSDYSENENVVEEIISMEEKENNNVKNQDENVAEILAESNFIIEKEKGEESVIEFEKTPVKLEKDISYFFKGKNIDKIISSIFDDDAEDFAHTFETLSECHNFREAQIILNGLFQSNHIKTTSKEALLMTEIINEYFSQK